jgi:predicted DNA-binding protein with PD1-like motif
VEVTALTDPAVSLNLEPGDEVTESIRRACETSRFSSAFIVGAGEIEDAEVLVLGPVAAGKVAPRTHRKVDGPGDLVSLVGHLTRGELELRAVIARETEQGPMLISGLLVRAIAVTARVSLQSIGAASRPAHVAPVAPPSPQTPAAAPAPTPFSGGTTTPLALSPAVRLPTKPVRPSDEPDAYPEENDTVNHFHFGRCTVLLSDGERLRLQQEKDGRVREVALSMLRVGEPTVLEDGRRHWDLARKN